MGNRILFDDGPITGKPSSKRAPKKSSHRHTYENCVLRYPAGKTFNDNKMRYMLASYCTQCGKIGKYSNDEFYHWMCADMRERPVVYLQMLMPEYVEAACDRYKMFDIDDIFDKYVTFDKETA